MRDTPPPARLPKKHYKKRQTDAGADDKTIKGVSRKREAEGKREVILAPDAGFSPLAH